MEVVDAGYEKMLECILEVRRFPFRNDPDREQALREVTTNVLCDLLKRLAIVTIK